MSKAQDQPKAPKNTVVVRSVHNARVPISRSARKQALEILRSSK